MTNEQSGAVTERAQVEAAGASERVDVEDDRLGRLLEKVERIERAIDRLDRASAAVPSMAATAVDAFDDSCARLAASGVALDQRLDRAARLLERLTDEPTARALEALLDRADRVEGLLQAVDELPGRVAMIVDVLDEVAARLAAEGIDLDTSLRQGLEAALWLGERISERELERFGIFLRSDVLEPHALTVIGKLGGALATCHSQACEAQTPERLGALGLLKALNDPEVQRAAAFAIQVARCLGGSLAEPAEIEAPSRNGS